MYFRECQPTGNPFVDKVISQRNETYAEIDMLREELQTIKDVLRSKQIRLRKMNQAIIMRQRSGNYLKLVSSKPLWCQLESAVDKGSSTVAKSNLRCVKGGRSGPEQ